MKDCIRSGWLIVGLSSFTIKGLTFLALFSRYKRDKVFLRYVCNFAAIYRTEVRSITRHNFEINLDEPYKRDTTVISFPKLINAA